MLPLGWMTLPTKVLLLLDSKTILTSRCKSRDSVKYWASRAKSSWKSRGLPSGPDFKAGHWNNKIILKFYFDIFDKKFVKMKGNKVSRFLTFPVKNRQNCTNFPRIFQSDNFEISDNKFVKMNVNKFLRIFRLLWFS